MAAEEAPVETPRRPERRGSVGMAILLVIVLMQYGAPPSDMRLRIVAEGGVLNISLELEPTDAGANSTARGATPAPVGNLTGAPTTVATRKPVISEATTRVPVTTVISTDPAHASSQNETTTLAPNMTETETSLMSEQPSSAPAADTFSCVGGNRVVVAAGDSLIREVANVYLGRVPGGRPFTKREVKRRPWSAAPPTLVAHEAHTWHPDEGNGNAAHVLRSVGATLAEAKRPGLVLVSFGAWDGMVHGLPPSATRSGLITGITDLVSTLTDAGIANGSRVVLYVPPCRPKRLHKHSPGRVGCWSGKRGAAYRRAAACAVSAVIRSLPASPAPPRFDAYDPCRWALKGNDVLGSTRDGLHFTPAPQTAVADDILRRFGATAISPASQPGDAGAECGGTEYARRYAWGTENATTNAAVAAAIDERFECGIFDRREMAAEAITPVPFDAFPDNSDAATNRPFAPAPWRPKPSLRCPANQTAVDTALGWIPIAGCACGPRRTSQLGDACVPSDAALDVIRNGKKGTFLSARIGGSLCALRHHAGECFKAQPTGLDLQGELDEGTPLFTEALLTVCAVPEAYGVCLLNLGARLGYTSWATPGSRLLNDTFRRFANVSAKAAPSVCRCGFRLDPTTGNVTLPASSSVPPGSAGAAWCEWMRPQLERAFVIHAAARSALRRNASAPLKCDLPTMTAMDLCATGPVRWATFYGAEPQSRLLTAAVRKAVQSSAKAGKQQWLVHG